MNRFTKPFQLLNSTGLFFLLFFIGQAAFAQDGTVTIIGRLLEENSNEALIGAYIKLKTSSDSIFKATVTDVNGNFRFTGIPAKPYILTASYTGFKEISRNVNPFAGQEEINLGQLLLAEDQKLLEEVLVEGKYPTGEQRGDTTSFNSRAFKTRPEADAEELIRKMPGIVIENGKIQAQGEDVKQILVDGKPFFGNDPNLAIKNLPAEIIARIEIYDQQSEQSRFSGFDDGETSKTINIVTYEDKRAGQFGKVYAGLGTDERYWGGGNLNFFNNDQRLSVIGLANNINQQNFSTQDILGVTGGGGGGGRRGGGSRGSGRNGGGGNFGGGSGINDFLVGQQNGLLTTNAFGLNYSDKWGEKIDFNASYFFNGSRNLAVTNISRDIFQSEGLRVFEEEQTISESKNYNHRLNARIDYKINETNSILFRPNLSIQTNRAEGEQAIVSLDENGNIINQTTALGNSEGVAYNFSNQLLYRHRFEKRGRTFSASLNTGLNNSENTSNSVFLDNLNIEVPSDSLKSFRNSSGFSYNTNLSYTEPVGEFSNLQLSYGFGNNISESSQETYRPAAGSGSTAFNVPDPDLSSNFENEYFTQRAGLGYRLNKNKLRIMANLSYQNSNLNSKELFPNRQDVNQQYHNLLPMAGGNYKFNDNANLRFFYRTGTNQPSITQLQDVMVYTNQRQMSSGNPYLDQQFSHNFNTRFSYMKPENSKTFMAVISGSVSNNYIGTSTIIPQQDTVINGLDLQRGGRYTTPVNLAGNRSARTFVTYGFHVKPVKSNINLNSGVSYSENPALINDRHNTTNTLNLSEGLVISSNISEKIDFNISTTANYNIVRNNLQPDLNNNYYQQNSRLSMHWTFWKSIFLENNLNHQYNSGLSEEVSPHVVMWNLSVGTRFLKNNRGELKISAYDLLKQNQNIQRNIIDGGGYEDVRTNALQRYVMATFTYNLRNFGKPSAPAKRPERTSGE